MSIRKNYEVLAARGNPNAIKALAAVPECPEGLEHLRSWVYELTGRSGVGMDGAAPLAWSEVESWERQTGYTLNLEEKRLLMKLDTILRHPEITDDEA